MKNRILPEIIKEVSEKGYHYVTLDSLKPVFGCEGEEKVCVKQRLLVWAVENHVLYEDKEVADCTMVRFIRREW